MKELRDQIPSLQKVHYFNYAKLAPMPIDAIQTIQKLIIEAGDPFELHKTPWKEHLERARKQIAELIGANVEEIALSESTSSALSLIAGSIRWKKGDRILYPADEYPSNRFVWDNLKDRGVETLAVPPKRGVLFSEQLERMDLSNVRLVAVSAVSFWDGRRHDLETLGKLCKANGILFSVDAIQAVGAIPVDVQTWNCDFLACGSQKWLFGPIGTGFAYFNRKIIPELSVPRLGWGSIKPLNDYLSPQFEFAEGAKRFETGFGNIPTFAGLASSIELMKSIGWEKIYSRIEKLAETAQKELRSLGCPPIIEGKQSGIIAFDHPKAESIQHQLEAEKIYTTYRSGRLRISLHASVSDEDLALLIHSLRALVR